MPATRSIIISDQNEQDREETAKLLRSHGFAVEGFPTGEEALEAARAKPPDLFITSMGLKGALQGLQFIRMVKEDERLGDRPIVFLTGARRVMNLPFNFRPDPVAFPVFDVIEKPARPEYLLEVVGKALGD